MCSIDIEVVNIPSEYIPKITLLKFLLNKCVLERHLDMTSVTKFNQDTSSSLLVI